MSHKKEERPAKYKRGFTAQPPASPDERPPSLKGRVYNEFRPDVARGSTMPAPTDDTEEPRLSQRLKGPLAKGSPIAKVRR